MTNFEYEKIDWEKLTPEEKKLLQFLLDFHFLLSEVLKGRERK